MNQINSNTSAAASNIRTTFFDNGTLNVDDVSQWVLANGPIGRGVDGHLWYWEGGVWKRDYREQEVNSRLVELLHNKYQPKHKSNVVQYLSGLRTNPLITNTPITDFINFKNGMLEWKTGKLHQHNESFLTTVQLPVDYDPAARCDRFLSFLGEVVHPDSIGFMQELTGYMMYAGNPFEKAIMLHGGGRNGKGTYLSVLHALLGKANVSHVSLQDLGGNRFAAAGLFGKLANIAGDLDGTMVENTGRFKEVVACEPIDAEYKGRDAFTFTPYATHIFSANIIPASSDTTTGYLDRWIVIPFPNYFGDRPDSNLKDTLTHPSEISGVARWGIEGLQRLMERGYFDLPQSIKDAKEDFARAIDPVRMFMHECAVRSQGYTPKPLLYPLYQDWCSSQGRRALGKQKFNERMSTLPGVTSTYRQGTEVYVGFEMTKTSNDFYNISGF